MKLATKLVIAMLFFATAAATIGTSISSNTTRKALQSNISKSQELETDQVMDKIDRFMYERTVDIQVVTERDQLETYLQQPGSRTPEITKRLVTQFMDFRIAAGVWGDMTLLDTKGKVMLTTNGPTRLVSLINQQEFKEGYLSAVSGHVVSSDVFLVADTKSPIELFMAPVRAQTIGKPIIGVVVGELAWSTVLQVLGNPGENVTAHLLNKDGYILGSSDPDKDFDEILVNNVADSKLFKAAAINPSNGSQSGIFPWLDDPSVHALSTYEPEQGYLSYKGNGWLLVFETPVNVAFAPANNLVRTSVISAVATTFLTLMALMWYIYSSVIKPIRKLRDAMSKIDEGDLTSQVRVNSRDEIGELGRAFNKMSEGLAASDLHLREEQARLTASINSLEVGFLMTDLHGEIVTINSSARTLLGDASKPLATDDWSLPKIAKLLKGSVDLPEILKNCLHSRHVINVKEVNFEDKVLRLFAAPILTQLNDDKVSVIGCVVLLEDVTKAIVQARSRDEFFSIASHELRTPLTSIRGNSSMMIENYSKDLKDPSLKEMVDDIHDSSIRLIEIVNDFLDVSRIEQGKIRYKFTELTLDEIIEKVVYDMRPVLREKKLYLDIESKTLGVLPHVAGDSDRVKQIIYNLIGNAVKFTETGGVKVTAARAGEMVKISITDTGRGISVEGQRLLFHKFQQTGDSLFTRDSTKGTGLGLYISKLLVEGMGGVISLESSEEDKGSTFAFTLVVSTPKKLAELQALTTQTGLVDTETGMLKNK